MDMAGTQHYGLYVMSKASIYTTTRLRHGKAYLTMAA